MTEIYTIGGSLVVSIFGMLLTNMVSSGWRTSKITADLREVVSMHVGELHEKVDNTADRLRMQVDGGLRTIDDKIGEHFRDDVINFAAIRRETGEMGHAIRERINQDELWNRDHFLQVKHFDDKVANILLRMDHQDEILDKLVKNGNH